MKTSTISVETVLAAPRYRYHPPSYESLVLVRERDGLEMNTDSRILVPAPAVRLMKSRVLSRPGVNSVPLVCENI